MRNEKITNGEGVFLVFLTLTANGFSVMFGSGAGRDAWLSHIIAAAAAFAVSYLLARACDEYPEKSFFEVLECAFGRVFGRVLAVLLIFPILASGVVSLTIFTRFVQMSALPRTPQIIIPLLITLTAALSFRSGLRSAAGASRLLFWFCVSVLAVFCIFGSRLMHIDGIFPVFENMRETLVGACEVFVNRFGLIFALMPVYTRMMGKKTRRRDFSLSVFASGVVMAVIALITVSILGRDVASRDFYPVFTAMSVQGVGGFIQHTEILACIAMTIGIFVRCAISILFCDEMLVGIFSVKNACGTALPIGLIISSATQLIYRDATSLRALVEWKGGEAYMLLFELILPVLLALFLKKTRNRRKNGM